MYLMFLGPFQEGGDFRDDGLNGPRRFLDKLWALVQQSLTQDATGGEIHHPILVKWHQTKKKAAHDIERLSYNTAIAAQMELLNTMREANCAERAVVEDMVLMVAPFAPHFAEEAWERLGHDRSIFEASWPDWDEALTVEDTVELAVQVNGKTRGKVTVRRDATEREVMDAARAEPGINKFLVGKMVRVILVPNRLLNMVVQ
jgi:leucyl-tRNA synthetase